MHSQGGQAICEHIAWTLRPHMTRAWGDFSKGMRTLGRITVQTLDPDVLTTGETGNIARKRAVSTNGAHREYWHRYVGCPPVGAVSRNEAADDLTGEPSRSELATQA